MDSVYRLRGGNPESLLYNCRSVGAGCAFNRIEESDLGALVLESLDKAKTYCVDSLAGGSRYKHNCASHCINLFF